MAMGFSLYLFLLFVHLMDSRTNTPS
ncbi:hypothetical protein TB1_020316 [Malus domestica]